MREPVLENIESTVNDLLMRAFEDCKEYRYISSKVEKIDQGSETSYTVDCSIVLTQKSQVCDDRLSNALYDTFKQKFTNGNRFIQLNPEMHFEDSVEITTHCLFHVTTDSFDTINFELI